MRLSAALAAARGSRLRVAFPGGVGGSSVGGGGGGGGGVPGGGAEPALRPPPSPFISAAPAAAAGPRRTVFPLFGLSALPPAPASLPAQLRATYRCGARYLGDALALRAADAAAPPALRLRRRLERAWSEVAFVGRSNAGKSSLLNALLDGGSGAAAFVRTSRRPGTTSRVDLFGCGLGPTPRLVLADTPGFGYSAGGRAAHRQWMREVGEFLQPEADEADEAGGDGGGGGGDFGSDGGAGGGGGGSSGGDFGGGGGGAAPSPASASSSSAAAAAIAAFGALPPPPAPTRRLARVVVLLDARLAAGAGLAPVDVEVLRLVEGAGLPLQAVLTKSDLVGDLELERAAAAAARQLGEMRTPFPYLLAVSSKTGEGIEALQRTLLMAARMVER